jgi:hypothetical protein
MHERRRVERLKHENEAAITTLSDEGTNPKEIIVLGQSKDISVLGTKIQINFYLPVNTKLKIDFKLKDLYHKITAIGKVKWIKANFKDESYDAGVEFVDSTPEEIEKRKNYISGKR